MTKPIIKTIIELDNPNSNFKNYKISVAYLLQEKPFTWSAKFASVPNYPSIDDVNKVIAKGFAMEVTGATDKFGNIKGQYRKQFN